MVPVVGQAMPSSIADQSDHGHPNAPTHRRRGSIDIVGTWPTAAIKGLEWTDKGEMTTAGPPASLTSAGRWSAEYGSVPQGPLDADNDAQLWRAPPPWRVAIDVISTGNANFTT